MDSGESLREMTPIRFRDRQRLVELVIAIAESLFTGLFWIGHETLKSVHRRLAVLAVLYFRRRTNPRTPEVSLGEIEKRMGFPRDYLDFTTWYLVKKGYITRADNSDFTLTADGVDFVETQRMNLPVLNKLLTNGKMPSATDQPAAQKFSSNGNTPIILHADMSKSADRRINGRGRRATDRNHRQESVNGS